MPKMKLSTLLAESVLKGDFKQVTAIIDKVKRRETLEDALIFLAGYMKSKRRYG